MRLCRTVVVVTDTRRRAVVERDELHSRRQGAVTVDLVDFRLDPRHHVIGVQRPVHHHDGSDDVVFAVAAGLAEPGDMADIDFGDVLDLDGQAVRLRQHDVADVADMIALGQIVGATAVQKADTADVDRLLPEIDGPTAHIGVGVADGADDLGQCDVESIKLVEIDLDLEFLRRSAPSVDLNDALDRQQAALHDPVLDGAKIGQAKMRRALDLITVDFPDQARPLNRRRDVVRQTDVLLQVDFRLGKSKIVVDAVLERHADEGEAVERRRADHIDPRRSGEADLHRDGVIALHLLGGETRRLRRDFENDRSRIGIGFDVQLS